MHREHIESTLTNANPQRFLLQVEMKGISGPIEFKEGRRIQFKLDVLKLKQHSLVKVRRGLTVSKIGSMLGERREYQMSI